jgi:hypothetical protein
MSLRSTFQQRRAHGCEGELVNAALSCGVQFVTQRPPARILSSQFLSAEFTCYRSAPLRRTVGDAELILRRTVDIAELILRSTVDNAELILRRTVGDAELILRRTVGDAELILRRTVDIAELILRRTVGNAELILQKAPFLLHWAHTSKSQVLKPRPASGQQDHAIVEDEDPSPDFPDRSCSLLLCLFGSG